jgi:hypothetical protein
MRYRLMATYRGVPYEAGIGPSEADVVLFAACPPPEELGFEPATGHWRKQLRIDEVQALWESKPTGKFRGERCIVLDDLGDRLHIAYLGHDAYQAEKLGYWQVDRGVFELVAPREEVVDIVEERADYPGRTAGGPPPGDEFSASPVAAPPVAAPPVAGPSVAGPSAVAGPSFTGSSAADPPSGAAAAPWPGGTGAAQPPAATAPRPDEVSTKLADLAAATLAHLATMSHAPVRDAPQEHGRVPARDLPRAPATDLPRVPAQDPAPYPVGLQSGRPGGSANGVAVHPVDFPVPAGPGNWPGSALGARISMPPPEEEPLPLEAAARRAASAATAAMRRARRNPARPDQAPAPDLPPPRPDTAPQDRAAPDQTAPDQAAFDQAAFDQAGPDQTALDQTALDQTALDQTAPDQARPDSAPAGPPRRRRTARMRVATQGIFSELAGLAAIPPTAYAVGAEVDGAMCLVQTGQGFEVFNAVAGTRHEVRSFLDEESAYFYLFGVLAADAVRTGRLMPSANGESAG